MGKKILLTGATDGIGYETAMKLLAAGHDLLLHGRSATKLESVADEAESLSGSVECFVADLSNIDSVYRLAEEVAQRHDHLDVLINNAGVFKAAKTTTSDGLDVRFAVNTIAPYVLTQRLASLLGPDARVINVSSAAQAPVDLDALQGRGKLSDGEAYAQSKLAITMWTRALAERSDAPMIVAVNPGSLLASKMVHEAYGLSGKDLGIGASILSRAALSDDFVDASGKYFDNDVSQFAAPHRDALNRDKCERLVATIDTLIASRATHTAKEGSTPR